MLFEVKSFWVQKRGNKESELEDAFGFDPNRGLAAVSDGAGDAIFSRLWATLLVQEFIDKDLQPWTVEKLWELVASQRPKWWTGIDFSSLPWNMQSRVEQIGGAFATFLGVRVECVAPRESTSSRQHVHVLSMGDCCIFHIRHGHLLQWFPALEPEDFGSTPNLFCSLDKSQDSDSGVESTVLYAEAGDFLVLASDAISCWMIKRMKRRAINWDTAWEMSQETWREQVEQLRDKGSVRNDDMTLLILRLLPIDTSTGPEPDSETPAAESSDNAPIVELRSVSYEQSSDDRTSNVAEREPAESATVVTEPDAQKE
jgi:serine/threonine protein phosphatase PrpC